MNKWYFSKYNKLGMDDIYLTIENKKTGEFIRFHETDYDLVTTDLNEELISNINSTDLDVKDGIEILKEFEINIPIERIFKNYSDIKCKPRLNYSIVYRKPEENLSN